MFEHHKTLKIFKSYNCPFSNQGGTCTQSVLSSKPIQNANPGSAAPDWKGQGPACFSSTGMEGPHAAGSRADQRHQTMQTSFAHGLVGAQGRRLRRAVSASMRLSLFSLCHRGADTLVSTGSNLQIRFSSGSDKLLSGERGDFSKGCCIQIATAGSHCQLCHVARSCVQSCRVLQDALPALGATQSVHNYGARTDPAQG